MRFRNPWRHHKVEGAALRAARSLWDVPDKRRPLERVTCAVIAALGCGEFAPCRKEALQDPTVYKKDNLHPQETPKACGFQHCLAITEPHSGPAKHHEIGLKIKMQLTADSCFSLLLLEAD